MSIQTWRLTIRSAAALPEEVVKVRAAEVKRMASRAIEELAMALDDGYSDSLKAYLAMLGRFHRYSIGNVILIGLQMHDATRVAGYRTWQQLGRQVKQGERAIRILAPITYRKRKEGQQREGEAEQKDEDAKEVLAFKPAAVFDVSQTNGAPLAEFARVSGDPAEHLSRLKDLVSSRGIGLEYTNRIGPAQGASAGGKIFLREDMEPAEEFSTLVHELAHEILHQDKTERSKTVRETEAEAVAFVVCEAIGLKCGTVSSDYVQLYDGKTETLLASLERIRETAAEIIEAVLSKSEQRAESTAQQESLAAA
jgi:antirestriction protein ArdC